MTLKKNLGLFLILVSCHQFLFGQQDVIQEIIRIGKTDNRTMQYLDVLSNRFGGRLTGSASYENAARWCAYMFEKWGMEVDLDQTGELQVGFNRGPWFGRMLGTNGMHLHFVTPSYTSGTKGVQRGHVVIEPKTQAEFDRMKGRLNGAWVLISGTSDGWPIDYTENGDKKREEIIAKNNELQLKNNDISRRNWQNRDGVQEELLPYIEEPALFYGQMVEAGILGIIQSAPVPLVALYDRKNVHNMTFATLPVVPDIKLNEHQYATILQMARERQFFLLEFDIRNYFAMGPVKYHNVIGIIPGTEFPDEYVILSAHLDAFDVASGGVDNGAGVTPFMEAARLLMEAGAKPRRTILVCLWAAEEFGLLGSLSWVERNQDKLDRITNVINRDGGPLVPSSMSVTDAMRPYFEEIIAQVNEINPEFQMELTTRRASPRPTAPRGTDATSFAMRGVPTIAFGTADPRGYDFQYREIWHTERDTYNMSIPEYQQHTAIVTAIAVLGLANLDSLLPREGYYTD